MSTEQFGRLTVIGEAEPYIRGNGHKVRKRKCQCICGKVVDVFQASLARGSTKSCGCIRAEATRERRTTHGMYSSGEYKSWRGMKSRCNDKGNAHYGLVGVSVCQRWTDSFGAFLEDMGPKPSELHSIDRIDSEGDYEPSNCRWATDKEQANNRSSNRMLTFYGKTMSMSAWCEISGVFIGLCWRRLMILGWTEKASVWTPVRRASAR